MYLFSLKPLLNRLQKINSILREFANLSGLRANPSKSLVFCAGMSGRQKEMLIESLEMNGGSLPVHYLGVLLISKKLSFLDCEVLMDKILRRINSWLSRYLSFAGRHQLLSSVLYSIQIYWSNTFILHKKVIRLIEQKFNRFLWNGSDASAAKAKVSWDALCVPMLEGGLGLRKIEDWNKASILKHIWNLVTKAGSIWVSLVKMNLIKGTCFWLLKVPSSTTWCWRKILKLRELVKNFFKFQIGEGSGIFL